MEEVISQFDISKEDVVRWKRDEVTQVFFGYVKDLLNDNRNKAEMNLANFNMEDAISFNAARMEDDAILDITNRIIEDFKLEEGEEKNEATSRG